MPRSSRHKSSKHSSSDGRECSDSDRDSGVKDHRKGGAESVAGRAPRDSGSSEKLKLDSKDDRTGNGEHYYGSSKRRRERRGGERRNGGDLKNRRRDESDGEGEEVKKHRDSGRKESREGRRENADLQKVDELRSPELDNQLERQIRKKRDSGDGYKHQDDVRDGYNRRLSSRDEIAKDGRQKDARGKDEKYRDKYREEMDRENKHRHDKQRDDHPVKDHTSIKSDDKHAREEKDGLEFRRKRTKLLESDCDQDRDHNHDGDCDLESCCEHEQHYERVHDCDYDLDRDHDYHRDRDRDRDQDHDHDPGKDHDCDHDHDHLRDRDGSHVDDRSARSKDSRRKGKALDDRDDNTETKSRVIKGQYPNGEKKSLSNCRADSDVDRGRSQPWQAYADSTGTNNKHRSSPASNTYIVKDEYRNANSEDPMYRDSMIEQRTKDSREGYSGISERGPKYKSMEKPFKIDDGPLGDLATERSSSAKAASMGLMERSPSASIEHGHINKIKSGVRRSFEIEESGRRNSIEARDFSASDDRLGLELTQEKQLSDEPPQAESYFYGMISQGNASSIPPQPAFRAALNRPFMDSLEDDVRDNSNTQYRRNGDHGFGRGHGNSWRAVPNWTSPIPNGFVSFQPGPAHRGFQTMMPQFTSQPLFGVRPSMEVNHAGIPYHLGDADRFPVHLHPLGWQNVMDGTGPAHLHGWESNNGVFRDDPHMYGGFDWDRNRHSANGRGREPGAETWKELNGKSKKDLPSPAGKDESVPVHVDDDSADQAIQVSEDDEHNQDKFHEKSPELSHLKSPSKVSLNSLATTAPEKVPDSSTPSDNTALCSRFYLSKLDISADLVSPELNDQYMCLMNDADASANLLQKKNGPRAQKIYAATFSRHSPLPAFENSVFQRAIDIYNKQRVDMPSWGKVDNIISVSNQVQLDEPIPRQLSAPASDGTEDVSRSKLDHKKLEALSPAKVHLEEIDQTCNQKGLDHDCILSSKPLASSSSSGHEKQREPGAGLYKKEDEVTSDKVNSGDAEEEIPMAFKNESQLTSTLHDNGDNMNSKAKTTGFAHHADEKQGFGDTVVSSLIFEDGSPTACDALMPGSNASESLILSRIHHSPESTH